MKNTIFKHIDKNNAIKEISIDGNTLNINLGTNLKIKINGINYSERLINYADADGELQSIKVFAAEE